MIPLRKTIQSSYIPKIHPYIRRSRIPELACMVVSGNKHGIVGSYGNIETNDGKPQYIHMDDYKAIIGLSKLCKIKSIGSIKDAMDVYEECVRGFSNMPSLVPSRKVAMASCGFGCGAWRMEFPAIAMSKLNRDVLFDVVTSTNSNIPLEEYDTIVMQWITDWTSYGRILELKSKGKRIVYDIDDDVFSIPTSNPAKKHISYVSQAAMTAIMSISDCVTVSTDVIAERISKNIDPKVPIHVIPNSIDTRNGWRKVGDCFSDDGFKRIFWFGSNTHDEDWKIVTPAIDRILRERGDVRLVLWGHIPKPIVDNYSNEPHWQERIEYAKGGNHEDFFNCLANNANADIGIAPLLDDYFNKAKSNIKFIEYTLAGMPVVASDNSPYSKSIVNNVNGLLCTTEDDWYSSISSLIDNRNERIRLCRNARSHVEDNFDIIKHANKWQKAILGDNRDVK